jgi:Leucine-rich repeat (LRR) protein
MNIIDSPRDQVIKENNTAQEELEGILYNLNPNTKQLVFSIALHGDLDLGILTRRGFRNVEEIILEEGEITSITNIPHSVLKLHCPNQLLIELFDLPPFLTELNCDYNYITTFSGKSVKKLTKLHISHNRLEELDDLPKDLEELYCTNNKLKILNLEGLINLQVLHISENPSVVIENVPEGLSDFKTDNSPFARITYDDDTHAMSKDKKALSHNHEEVKIEYIEALNIYFKLKSSYENSILTTKRNIFRDAKTKTAGKRQIAKVKPKCINCGRPVGTIFSHKNDTYTAICGDTNLSSKCGLNIQLYSGVFAYSKSLLYLYKEDVDKCKEDIIRQKLDTLFHYITDREATSLFKETLNRYNLENGIYLELLDDVNAQYYTKSKQEVIDKKKLEINVLLAQYNAILEEYKQNAEKHELLRDAMQLYVREIVPEMENLRRLKNELTEMDIEIKTVVKTYDIKSTLVQRTTNLSSLDVMISEPQHVVKFSKKA